MSNSVDGVDAYISEFVDAGGVQFIETRPTDRAYVRVTAFPWETGRLDPDAPVDASDDEAYISRESVYEVSIWRPVSEAPDETTKWVDDDWDGGPVVCETLGPFNGAEPACECAIQTARDTNNGVPVWDTILRLRPSHVIIQGTDTGVWDTVSERPDIAVISRPMPDSDVFDEEWVAIDRDTLVCSWGPAQDEAIDALDRSTDHYERRAADRATSPSPDEYVAVTPDVLGGDPRLSGTRIPVTTLIAAVERCDTIERAASSYGVSIPEVEAVVEWADAHNEDIERLQQASQDVQWLIEEYRTPPPEPEWVDGLTIVTADGVEFSAVSEWMAERSDRKWTDPSLLDREETRERSNV